ncbi:MAG: hypothetical protein O7F17_04920 [Planctomycetota bacterium]|nr:hypothetical protein [Planctomycetota bacterium]
MAGWVEEPGAAVGPGRLDNPSTLSVLSESVNDLLKTAGRCVDPAIGPGPEFARTVCGAYIG